MRNISFDDTAKKWDEYYNSLTGPQHEDFKKEFKKYTHNHTWLNSIRIIEKLSGIKNHDKVLDAGGGWGRLLLGVLEHHTNLDITVLDFQRSALNIGKQIIGNENNGNRISWEEGNIESLSYPDNSFDCIYSGRVFQHLNSPEKGASEIVRVLKPGGKFVIFLQNKLCPLNLNYYSRLYSPHQVGKWFEKLKLTKLKASSMDFCPKVIGSMGVEQFIENIPFVNKFGGKVVVWGIK